MPLPRCCCCCCLIDVSTLRYKPPQAAPQLRDLRFPTRTREHHQQYTDTYTQTDTETDRQTIRDDYQRYKGSVVSEYRLRIALHVYAMTSSCDPPIIYTVILHTLEFECIAESPLTIQHACYRQNANSKERKLYNSNTL